MSPSTKFRPELIDLFVMMPPEHQRIWKRMVRDTGGLMYSPDLTLAPDGCPYIYRWYMVKLDREVMETEVMFHIQVASDPERPLHDHPWDNVSHILAGEYIERIQYEHPVGEIVSILRQTGEVFKRNATDAHRLILRDDTPYVMTLFTTGPKVREWGFWYPDGWHHNKQHVAWRGNESIHVEREKTI